MIDVKQAVRAAVDYVHEFQDLLPPRELRLEETEFVEGHLGAGVWQITLSFLENQVTGARSYKSFTIDAETGEIKAMKVRSLLTAR
jgi:hypothetical protein